MVPVFVFSKKQAIQSYGLYWRPTESPTWIFQTTHFGPLKFKMVDKSSKSQYLNEKLPDYDEI